MASRARVDHDDGMYHAPASSRRRPRREVWFHDEEPLTIPRKSLLRDSAGLVVAFIAASALVVGSGYAAYYATPPALAETPTLPIARDWQGDPEIVQANVTNLLSGPAFAVPERTAPESVADEQETVTDTPSASPRSATPTPRARAAPATPDAELAPPPLTAPDVLPQAPYPNPTTTPPEGIAPPDAEPRTPALEPDNPYGEQKPSEQL